MSKSNKQSSAKKTTDFVKTEVKKSEKSATVMSAERQRMISEAAYYLAEQRGFSPGDEMEDWLQAESQVNASLTQKGG